MVVIAVELVERASILRSPSPEHNYPSITILEVQIAKLTTNTEIVIVI